MISNGDAWRWQLGQSTVSIPTIQVIERTKDQDDERDARQTERARRQNSRRVPVGFARALEEETDDGTKDDVSPPRRAQKRKRQG